MTAGQVSDYTGARALVSNLPAAEWLLGDRGYDADWFREALVNIGIKPCIPGRKSRSKAIKYDKRRYKKRNRIEIMFGRLKDWRRVATRYDRCPKVFMSAIDLAATVLFWLWVLSLKVKGYLNNKNPHQYDVCAVVFCCRRGCRTRVSGSAEESSWAIVPIARRKYHTPPRGSNEGSPQAWRFEALRLWWRLRLRQADGGTNSFFRGW